jgi:hypothetical protein
MCGHIVCLYRVNGGKNLERWMNVAGEDFNTMERSNTNMAVETNVKKTMIKIKSSGG